MKFLQTLYGKKARNSPKEVGVELSSTIDEGFFIDDFLGLAENQGSKARAAIEVENFDDAWRHYQKMGQLYLRHAKKEKFTPSQTFALVSSIHRAMAKLLMIEKKHDEALIHILYCISCSNGQLDKEIKNYRPFFNRCKFKTVKLEEVTIELETWKGSPDFVVIRNTVAKWKEMDNGS